MVAAGIVVLILAVFAIGSALPIRHVVTRRSRFRATPEQLFARIAGDQSWRPAVTRYEVLPSQGGHELVRETTRDGESITYELMERRAPLHLKRRIASENLPYSGSWEFALQPEGEMTVVRITEDGEVKNPIFRFMSRFVFGQRSTMEKYLRALGEAIGQQVNINE